MPSGPIPTNPSELISNGRLQKMLAYLDTQFDYILIDTTTINPTTDAFILSPLCDVTLFVVRHAYTSKVFLQKLEEKFKTKSLKNPAIAYNGIKEKDLENMVLVMGWVLTSGGINKRMENVF